MDLVRTSPKGISAMKLSQWLGVSYKTAWHLGHRIRAMMASEPTLHNDAILMTDELTA